MATRNIVPNNDSEGNIGNQLKRWIKGWFVDLFVSGDLTDGTDSVTINDLAQIVNNSFVFTQVANNTNLIQVEQESDFGTAVGNVITLQANTTYFVRGIIDCTNQLLVDQEGIVIIGFDRDKDGLNFIGSGYDFLNVVEVNFGMSNLKFSSTNNVSGEVFLRAINYDNTAFNAGRTKLFTIVNCQFRNTYDISYVEGFDLVDWQNTLCWYSQADTIGCQFKNCSKLQISSCEFVRWFDETSIPTPAGYATTPMIHLLPNGLGVGIGAVNINGCVIHPQQQQDGIFIDPACTIGFGTITGNTGVETNLSTGLLVNFDYNVQNSTIIQANQSIQNGNAKGILDLANNVIELNNSAQTPVGGLYQTPVADPFFVGGAGPTNPIQFFNTNRVITSAGNGSFEYNSKIDGNFAVNLNASVGVNSNGTFNIQIQFRQNGVALPIISKTTIRNSAGIYLQQPIGLSVLGTATQGDVFDVLISIDTADNVLLSELTITGYQF